MKVERIKGMKWGTGKGDWRREKRLLYLLAEPKSGALQCVQIGKECS